ncbi:MAG TPA: tyrosine-type recombinase/integrase [Acidobacteriota bacterium]|nr:tyrosine-type recombinase/integrase [Acidobacteriota bacterium]
MARKGDGIYKRGKVWRLDMKINGIRHQGQLGRGITRDFALELARAHRESIMRGEAGLLRKKLDMTFEEAKAVFLAAVKGAIRANTHRSYETCLDSMTDFFKGKNLSEISPFLLESWKKQRKDEAPVGFNRELGTLKTMFNWCIDNGRFQGANPCRKVKRLQESHGRERALDPDEEVKFLGACSEPLRTIVLCGIDAGLRIPSETLWLKKDAVDLRGNRITVPAVFAKNSKKESVPLTGRLREALRHTLQHNPESEYLFTKRDGRPYRTIQNIFRTAAKRAGLMDISPHVCRHTFATNLDQSGASLRTIQELGRWGDIRMVQRYSNVNERIKREAIQKMSQNSPQLIPSATDDQAISYDSNVVAIVNGKKA